MTTAAAPPVAEQRVDRAAHTFITRGTHERLTRRPKRHAFTATGVQQVTDEGLHYFAEPDGQIVVHEGQDILTDDNPAQLVSDAELEARGCPPAGEPRDAVQWLRGHPQCNVRFHEVGNEPGRLLPFEEDFLSEVTGAATALDADRLGVLLAEEQAGHNRRPLVLAVEQALEQVKEASQAPAE